MDFKGATFIFFGSDAQKREMSQVFLSITFVLKIVSEFVSNTYWEYSGINRSLYTYILV